MIDRTTAYLPSGLALPVITIKGAADGPHLTVISGVHGAEYCSVAAVQRFVDTLDTKTLAGRVTAVPIANPTSFWQRTPFVTPEDGKNLNRVFPGDANGTFAEKLALELFERFVLGSDYLVHVHGGSTMEYVEPFVGYDVVEVADVSEHVEHESRELALAYGIRFVLRSERVGSRGSPTMLRTAAAEAGIPALLTEAGDQGFLNPQAVDLHVRGLRRLLVRVGMLSGQKPGPEGEHVIARSFVPVRAPCDGWWEPSISVGRAVRLGDPVGGLYDLFGSEIDRVMAPIDGICLVLMTSPAAPRDSALAYIAAELETRDGTPFVLDAL